MRREDRRSAAAADGATHQERSRHSRHPGSVEPREKSGRGEIFPAGLQPWGGNIAPTRLSDQYPSENSLAADLSMNRVDSSERSAETGSLPHGGRSGCAADSWHRSGDPSRTQGRRAVWVLLRIRRVTRIGRRVTERAEGGTVDLLHGRPPRPRGCSRETAMAPG